MGKGGQGGPETDDLALQQCKRRSPASEVAQW